MNGYRERALDEYGRECMACGGGDGIEVHHRDGDRTNNELDNLIPLCRSCHAQVHGFGLDGLENELKPLDERAHRDISCVVSVKVTERLDNRICCQLEYGDSKSEFVRNAVHRKLESNPGDLNGGVEETTDESISVKLFDGMQKDIAEHLDYGDSKSGFIRAAIQEQLERLEERDRRTAEYSETQQIEVSEFAAVSGGGSE